MIRRSAFCVNAFVRFLYYSCALASGDRSLFYFKDSAVKDLYDSLCEWLSAHPITTGGVLALILTGLRVGLSETKKSFGFVCLEGLACGLLSMAFSYAAINMMNFDPSIGIFIGSTAGFIGIERIQTLMIKILDAWIASRSGHNKENDHD